MVLVRKSYRRQILVGLLLLVIAAIFTGYQLILSRSATKVEAFAKAAELPAPFVRLCQKTALQYELRWELVAAIFQVQREHGLLENYPDNSGDVENVARKLAPVAKRPIKEQLVKKLGFPKNLADEMSERSQLLQDSSFLYSANYAFPYQQKVYYTDTWGAAREGGNRTHEGTDLFAAEGTPIYAVTAGKVEKLGWNRLGGERVGIRGYDTVYYYYAHLSKINANLTIGMPITKGTLLGYTGHTGDAITTPDHLHFGMELHDGTWINPYNLLHFWQGN